MYARNGLVLPCQYTLRLSAWKPPDYSMRAPSRWLRLCKGRAAIQVRCPWESACGSGLLCCCAALEPTTLYSMHVLCRRPGTTRVRGPCPTQTGRRQRPTAGFCAAAFARRRGTRRTTCSARSGWPSTTQRALGSGTAGVHDIMPTWVNVMFTDGHAQAKSPAACAK